MNHDHTPTGANSATHQIGMSNTEVSTGSGCQRAWLFGFHPETRLKQKTQGVALTRGITGHGILEAFYKDIQKERPYDEAVSDAVELLENESKSAYLNQDLDKLEMLNHLKKIMIAYFEHYEDDIKNWEVLDVESFHLLTWDGEDSLYLPMRIDLVIYQKTGKFKGEISPVDHKFTNDFWNQWQIRLNSQIPLNIAALRNARYSGKGETVVARGIVNQIRTRSTKHIHPLETFRRSFVEPTSESIDKVFMNHLKKAKVLEPFKRMSYEQAHEETTTAWGSQTCKFCFFKSICATDLEGGNVQEVAAVEYERSDYGYPSIEELYREQGGK